MLHPELHASQSVVTALGEPHAGQVADGGLFPLLGDAEVDKFRLGGELELLADGLAALLAGGAFHGQQAADASTMVPLKAGFFLAEADLSAKVCF